jgi:hypothetical protein
MEAGKLPDGRTFEEQYLPKSFTMASLPVVAQEIEQYPLSKEQRTVR